MNLIVLLASVAGLVNGGVWNEAPAVVKHGEWYFLIGSGCTGWRPNTARLYRAKSVWGPWERLGNPCRGIRPAVKEDEWFLKKAEIRNEYDTSRGIGGDLTWGGQSTGIFEFNGTAYAMFDLWRPDNAIDGRYVWLPIAFGTSGEMTIDWREEFSPAAGAAVAGPRNSDGVPFVHPGIFYTQGDLDRMKAMVAAGREPWKRTFEELKACRFSNPGILSRPRGEEIPEGKFNVTIGIDGRSAHDVALLWRLTGDEAYAKKAREFLVNNSNYTATSWKGTGPLDNGKIFLLIEAAELMRDYPGWTQDEQAKFAKMLREVFYPHIKNGDVMRWGNQGLMAWHGVLAMAIYLDDRKMYDRVWNNVMGLPHRPDDEPYASGGAWSPDWPADFGETMITRRNHPVLGKEPDWGYGDQLQHYIYRNGQTEEACRDQAHATFGLFQMVSLAEIFWNQGDDLYGALDDRILAGLEWTLRYNLSDWEPSGYTNDESAVSLENGLFFQARTRNNRWTALKPSPARRGSDGGPGAPKTAALVHYGYRKGVPKSRLKWLLASIKRQLDAKEVESWGFGANWYYEYEGWGTLTKARTSYQHGDPGVWKDGVRFSGVHAVPGVMRAVDFDFHAAPTNTRHPTWYCPGTPAATSKYRSDAAMPMAEIEGCWCLGPLRDGEWAEYTLAAPETRKYQVEIVYRNLGALELELSADGGSPLVRRLPKAEKLRKFSLGELELTAGAPVLKLTIVAASASAVYGITLK